MIIAREKRKTNLAEYILYMWQLEDMLRGFGMDIGEVDRHVVAAYNVDETTRKEIKEWYDNLIEMMKKEEVVKYGHLQVVRNMVAELTELHFRLLHQDQDLRYRSLFMAALTGLTEYRRKSMLPDDTSDVELALHALYGHFMLKLQKKEVHSQTVRAMDDFSKMLAYLAARYRMLEEEQA